jgi:6,7-dimethyl-8-ribityllumazine synthase
MVGFTRNLGSTSERPVHLLVVEARFYKDISDELLAGATAAIERAGATFERVTVPGALEIPAAVAASSVARRRTTTRLRTNRRERSWMLPSRIVLRWATAS